MWGSVVDPRPPHSYKLLRAHLSLVHPISCTPAFSVSTLPFPVSPNHRACSAGLLYIGQSGVRPFSCTSCWLFSVSPILSRFRPCELRVVEGLNALGIAKLVQPWWQHSERPVPSHHSWWQRCSRRTHSSNYLRPYLSSPSPLFQTLIHQRVTSVKQSLILWCRGFPPCPFHFEFLIHFFQQSALLRSTRSKSLATPKRSSFIHRTQVICFY